MVELVPFSAQKEEGKSRWLQGWVSCLATAQHCRGPLYGGSMHTVHTLTMPRHQLLQENVLICQILPKNGSGWAGRDLFLLSNPSYLHPSYQRQEADGGSALQWPKIMINLFVPPDRKMHLKILLPFWFWEDLYTFKTTKIVSNTTICRSVNTAHN